MIEINTSLHETDSDPEAPLGELLPLDQAETNKDTLLYPGVQHVMDKLKRIVNENPETDDIEYTPSGEPILTSAILNEWSQEVGFSKGKRGTFHNEDAYVYIKYCNEVPHEQEVDKAIATARHLTSLGAIHPESQWGAYKTDGGDFQLFVVSPKLEAWSLEDALAGAYDDRPIRPMSDLSHLVDWFKRIDPDFIPGQPIPERSLLYHLNWTEASHRDNWGWDETGALFPVDVEVLRPNKPGRYKNPEPWKPHPTSYNDDIAYF
jgi:hypothetical protein